MRVQAQRRFFTGAFAASVFRNVLYKVVHVIWWSANELCVGVDSATAHCWMEGAAC